MSLKSFKLSVKIPLIMLVLAVANASAVTYLATREAEQLAIELTQQKITAARAGVAATLSAYLSSIKEDLIINAESHTVTEALESFNEGWEALGDTDKTGYLQGLYITENPNEIGKKDLLNYANDGSLYSSKHAEFHPLLRDILTQHEYYDIFLINTRGQIVYTVYKEGDFATDLQNGKWKDTSLANLFNKIKSKPVKGSIVFESFAPYAPSNNVPAAFVGTPILSQDGQFAGVLAYQMPIGRINKITTLDKEVSESAEVHLVNEQRYLINDPDTSDKEDLMLKRKIDNGSISLALSGKSGYGNEEDEGEKTLVSYQGFDAYGTKYALYVDIFQSEALAPIMKMEYLIWAAAAAILLVVTIISIVFARTITIPIKNLMSSMTVLANRDYSAGVPYRERGDEIGDMARSVEVFKQNGLEVQKLEAEQEQLKARAAEEQKAAMNKMADDFESRTAGIIKSLAAAATEMQATAAQMTAASGSTANASQIVAAAATEADSNVQTVAAATEELSASSSEIARQISSVAEKSTRASSEAVKTSEQVNELNSLADSIGEVIGAIKDIAEQTNLLALNATIEAARAGEAGKGFAVVADEVKKLATETASKTVQIDERVGKIQAAIRSTVDAVGRIINDVRDIDHSTATVASAVEEQNAATAEIGRNVSEASTGTQQVAQNIVDVQRSAEETGEAASNLNQAAIELAEISENLQEQVGIFLTEIRRG